MLAWWIFDRTPGDWKDVTAGVASVATAVAVLVGGAWAWRTFRRTPESRIKIGLRVDVDWADPASQHVVVRVAASNDGGYPWRLWWASESASVPVDLPAEIDVAGQDAAAHDAYDVSRVTLYALPRGAPQVFDGGYANWLSIVPARAELGCENVELRPKDVWTNDILFLVPSDSVAVLVVAHVWVRSRKEIRPIETFRVQVRPKEV